MYKVCIVDDEVLIQNSIVVRLLETKLPLKVEGCAADGGEALRLYRSVRPDICFVDINMPGRNGLQYIRDVREEDPECTTKFIIISGYDDFKYVQEAIKIGVTDYIKKPIDVEEFNEVVATVVRALQKERGLPRPEGGLYYDEWIVRSSTPRTFSGGVLLAVYSPLPDLFLNSGYISALLRLLETPKNDPPLCLLFKGNNQLRVYYSGGQPEARLLEHRCRELPQPLGTAYACVFPQGESPAALIDRAEQAINLRFVQSGYCFTVGGAPVEKPAIDMELLDYALENGKSKICRKMIEAYLGQVREQPWMAQSLSLLYRQIVSLVINKYVQRTLQIPEDLKNEFSNFALSRFPTMQALSQRLEEITGAFCREIEQRKMDSELIGSVCAYIRQHYTENLTLNDLANHFYVTAPYLSRRFKEKTGSTFVQYLENLRMEQAKEFLEHSGAQIADISARVGYGDSNYFAKVFRKKYHISPSDYRAQYENQGTAD